MEKSSPIKYLLSHRKTVLNAYKENNQKASAAWGDLTGKSPEIARVMGMNTFKQYLPLLKAFNDELDKVIQDKENVIQKLDNRQYDSFSIEKQLHLVTNGLNEVILDRDNVIQKLDKMELQNTEICQKVKGLESELDKIIQTGAKVNQKLDKHPKRVDSWTVQKSKDGYYRCYRKIGKKLHSVYIGKSFEIEKAKKRIAEKERGLG